MAIHPLHREDMPMHTKWQALMGFTRLAATSMISVSGVDAEKFLQGQLTVNLKTVTPNQSQLGAHCNLKGRMQSLFRLVTLSKQDDIQRYLLIAPTAMINPALAALKKYAMFSKVNLMPAEDFTLFGLIGDTAASFLAEQFVTPGIRDLAVNGVLDLMTSHSLVICRLPGPVQRFMLIVANTQAESFALTFKGVTEAISETIWELCDIEAGIPTIYPETEDLFLPHHANLPQLLGVSFDKGCYLGQEIIARMHYKGKIKRHLYRAKLTETTQVPAAGDQLVILDAPNEAPGIIVRAAPTETGFEVLLVIDEQYADLSRVRLKNPDGAALQRLDMPY